MGVVQEVGKVVGEFIGRCGGEREIGMDARGIGDDD